MILGSPWWLLLLSLGLLVVVLHLRRRRNVEVSSIYLWRRIASLTRSQASSRLPVFSILLLLQLLTVVLLAFALSRPLLGQEPQDEHWIVVLDASGSMQATDVVPSRFEAAKAHLLEVLEQRRTRGDRGRVTLLAATPHPYVAGARLVEQGPVRAALERVPASHAPADWERVAALLPGVMIEGESTRITVLTDDPQVEEGLTAAVAPEAELMPVYFGERADNLALTSANVQPLDEAEDRWRVTGTLRRYGTEITSVPISILFAPEGTEGALPWHEAEIEVADGAEVPFEFEVELPDAGVLELRLPDDALQQDNRASFVIFEAPKTVQVLHVGPENLPLQRALEAVSHIELSQADTLPSGSGAYDLVVIDRVQVARHPGTHTLWLGAVPPDQDQQPLLLENSDPSGWQTGHPLAASVEWQLLEVAEAQQVARLPGAEVLLEASGFPLVQARTTNWGHEVVVAFALEDTTWPEQLGFPIFISNLISWLEPDLGNRVAAPCEVGQTCPLDPRHLVSGSHLLDPEGEEMPLPSVEPEVSGWLPRGFEAFFRPDQVGIYTHVSGENRWPIAVNAFYPRESALPVADGEEPSPPIVSRPSGVGLPLWVWLLLLTLLVLLIEGWMAGRRTERFLRRSALASSNPLAGRRRLLLGLRFATLVFLLLAVLQLPWVYPVREQQVVLVVDDPSLYSEQARSTMRAFLTAAGEELGSSRQGGLVQLGSGIASDLGSDLNAELSRGEEDLPISDLEAALSLAAGMLSESEAGRIVLVSDGSESRGSAAAVLPQLIERNIPVDVYPVGGVPTGEVLVEQVTAPARLHAGDPFLLEGIVYSERREEARVRIYREGEIWAEQETELLAGRNRVEARLSEDEAGTYLYEVEVEAPNDVFSQNNRNGTAASVGAEPKIAIFTPQETWGTALAEALEVQGITAEVLPPDRMPHYLGHENPRISSWLDYDVAILMNVPAIELQFAQQELLQARVRDHGGGLIVLGGENTFGPGGYYQTVLEEMLPLSTEIPQERPSVAIAFVLDRSGSMQQAAGEVNRLDIAKRATLGAVELLDEESLVSVIAFDSEAQALIPLQLAGDVEQLEAQLEPLQPGGGTSIYPGLVLAHEQLSQADEEMTRHIVVMTDGLSQPGDFEEILAEITEDGITLSTAAIGRGADVRLLENLARLGGGAAHATEDFQALPSILAQEALLLSDEPVQQETFTPLWGDRDAPFLAGLPASLPPLHGHVMTSEKPGARVHLYAPDDAPLLGSWRYGLGRVAAFASHGAGPWAADWLAMQAYPRFWAQLVRWALPSTFGPGLHLDVERVRDEVLLSVEALGAKGEVQPGLELEAVVRAPGGEQPIHLREVASGRYEGSFLLEATGRHDIRVQAANVADDDEAALAAVEHTLHVAYPARYNFAHSNADLLESLVQLTGGRMLLGDETLFVGAPPLRWVAREAWPLWVLIALALFVVDLLVRYAPSVLAFRGWRLRRGPKHKSGEPATS